MTFRQIESDGGDARSKDGRDDLQHHQMDSFGWRSKSMTSQYGFEPDGHMCFSWFMNNELVLTTYVDQLVTLQLLN